VAATTVALAPLRAEEEVVVAADTLPQVVAAAVDGRPRAAVAAVDIPHLATAAVPPAVTADRIAEGKNCKQVSSGGVPNRRPFLFLPQRCRLQIKIPRSNPSARPPAYTEYRKLKLSQALWPEHPA